MKQEKNEKKAVTKKARKLAIAKVVSVEAKLSTNCPKNTTEHCGIAYRSS